MKLFLCCDTNPLVFMRVRCLCFRVVVVCCVASVVLSTISDVLCLLHVFFGRVCVCGFPVVLCSLCFGVPCMCVIDCVCFVVVKCMLYVSVLLSVLFD